MTVSSTTSRVSYAGNGSTTTFSVPFYFLDQTHLRVVLRSAAGVETVQTITTNYTVSGAGNTAGGSITMLVAPASGTTLVISRSNVPQTQLVDYQANDPFPANTHEQALDQLTMEVQQLQSQLDRSIKIAETDSTSLATSLPTSNLRANKALVFDASGGLTVSTDNYVNQATNAAASASAAATSASSAAASASSASATFNQWQGIYYGSLASDPTLDPLGNAMNAGDLYYNTASAKLRVYTGSVWSDTGTATPVTITTQTFSGNGSTTAFTLSSAPSSLAATEVFISGVAQTPTTAFSVSGTTLTFTTAPTSGTNNVLVRWVSAIATGVPNDGSVTEAKLADDTRAAIRAQQYGSGTTSGSSTAYTLSVTPALTSYAANRTFWVTFHAASGASPTLQISGLASPPNLVKQNAAGSYVNIAAGDFPINHRSRVTLLSSTQALVEELPPLADRTGTTGQVLTAQGVGAAPIWSSPSGGASGGQVFTASGTFTIPTGVTAVKVTVVGGGGGSGGILGTGCGSVSSGTGGGAGTAFKYLSGLTPGNTLTVTVGSGGTAGAATPTNGGAGGNSSVASGTQSITTIQGSGGGGSLGRSTAGVSAPGTPGGTSGGDYSVPGAGGYIGNSLFGFVGPSLVDSPGTSGVGYGAGAGGAFEGSGNISRAGAAGTAGIVIFEW